MKEILADNGHRDMVAAQYAAAQPSTLFALLLNGKTIWNSCILTAYSCCNIHTVVLHWLWQDLSRIV